MISGKCAVSGCAGFIGSHLIDRLISEGCEVVGLDNLSSGNVSNLDAAVRGRKGFTFIEGDIRNPEDCRLLCSDARYVFHLAAIGSVPQSLRDPLETSSTNSEGFVKILEASRLSGVERVVYASSSAVYGNKVKVPVRERDVRGYCLSPYAASKLSNEAYASAYSAGLGLESVGLRYFNVFGERQNPSGHYAAVISRWVHTMFNEEACTIYGDGTSSRDYSYVGNIVEATLTAAVSDLSSTEERVFNIASGESTTLNALFEMISKAVRRAGGPVVQDAVFEEYRHGDIMHSQADIRLAERILGYHEVVDMKEGLRRLCRGYAEGRA